ncbi:putative LRR receptor-like serine/threonine-protein kinase [Senna tora]|uniref:Putative LRR receptor-like serine/threonine-protein kinase n=1 Tax=Senna tora TaxID=362788 RepID=A0A834U1F5_9FABA|nr:putative LRR receptor-like serine/threonine-protein kinase [Senna tora]
MHTYANYLEEAVKDKSSSVIGLDCKSPSLLKEDSSSSLSFSFNSSIFATASFQSHRFSTPHSQQYIPIFNSLSICASPFLVPDMSLSNTSPVHSSLTTEFTHVARSEFSPFPCRRHRTLKVVVLDTKTLHIGQPHQVHLQRSMESSPQLFKAPALDKKPLNCIRTSGSPAKDGVKQMARVKTSKRSKLQ